jgi:hypothetical protein
MNRLWILLACGLILASCVKDEWKLNDQTRIDGLDPSFAFPLLDTRLNLGNLEQEFDSENFIYNAEDETFALVYAADLFRFGVEDLQNIQEQQFDVDYALSAGEATALTALPAGNTASFSQSSELSFAVDNGEELDSIRFAGGALSLELSSTIPHDVNVGIQIPGLTLNGVPFVGLMVLDYTGLVPFFTTESFDLTGYVLDLTQNGTTNNTMDFDLEFIVTSSGMPTAPASSLELNINLDVSQFRALHGYLGQLSAATSVDTQFVNLFRDLNGGVLYFQDPKIELTISNTTGIPVNVFLDGVYAPENSEDQQLSGPDLTNFPQISPAAFPGDIAVTEHVISNAGTDPPLSSLLDEGPFELIYFSELSINLDGPTQNFLLDTSYIACHVDMILPFFGYADNFALSDTLDLDLEAELLNAQDGNLGWEDVKKVTLRLIADNGLPIQIAGQVYFADTNNVIIDSLFQNQYEAIFEAGYVDFSLPDTDPNYGKVIAFTRKITDVVLTSAQLKALSDAGSKKVILRSRANTNEASNGEVVRFYPEYELKMKLSAKIDTDININE